MKPAPEGPVARLPDPVGSQPGFGISVLVRRVHLYLGLFLVPWMVMYALSTLCMNHREFVQSFSPRQAPRMLAERELEYRRTFPATAAPEEIGRQVLQDLGLDGTHRVSGGRGGKPLVIDRQHAVTPRRITWDTATGKLVLERQEFRADTFLERMHRRRGYQQPHAVEDTWAFSVDLAVLAMVFWSLSGLWLWWEIRATRPWGILCGMLGAAVFALLLAVL